MKKQTEIQIQAEIFKTIWNKYPQTRYLLFHVPNGGFRNKIEAMQLKASGVIAGVPDFMFLWDGKAYGIELKTEVGKLSPVQIKLHEQWEMNKIRIFVVRSVEEGVSVIESIINSAKKRF